MIFCRVCEIRLKENNSRLIQLLHKNNTLFCKGVQMNFFLS